MRSTTQSMVIDYLGPITAASEGLPKPWTLPACTLAIGSNGLPTGTISHSFHEQLTDVYVIYCPGGGQTPGLPSQTQPKGRPLVYHYKNANNRSEEPIPRHRVAGPFGRHDVRRQLRRRVRLDVFRTVGIG